MLRALPGNAYREALPPIKSGEPPFNGNSFPSGQSPAYTGSQAEPGNQNNRIYCRTVRKFFALIMESREQESQVRYLKSDPHDESVHSAAEQSDQPQTEQGGRKHSV